MPLAAPGESPGFKGLRLRDAGYKVWTQKIPETITPKNRLLMGRPREQT